MVRFRRIEQHDRFFFITTNLRQHVAPMTPNERDLLLEVIGSCRKDFYLFAYVVMPTHLHMVLAPNGKALTMIMRDIKSKSGFRLAKLRRTMGPIWQERFFDNIIRRVRRFWEKVEYVHNNPVADGLVPRPEDWKWSSARHCMKLGESPLTPDPVDLPVDGDALLWPAPYGN